MYTLVQNVDSGGGCVCVWEEGTYESSLYFALNFSLNLKLLSKIKSIKKLKKKKERKDPDAEKE